MAGSSIKKELFEEFSDIARATASPVRLEILDYLAQGECTVEFLAEKCGQKLGNVSQHLRLLLKRGLVKQRREGTFVHYRSTAAAGRLLECLASVAADTSPRVQEIRRSFFHSREDLFKKSDKEVLDAVERGEIVLIDVRPADEFKHGHIAGARSVPLKDLVAEMNSLPGDREIVAYCRGPWCVLAVEAVELLRRKGFRASRLEDGFPQWQSRELPTS